MTAKRKVTTTRFLLQHNY